MANPESRIRVHTRDLALSLLSGVEVFHFSDKFIFIICTILGETCLKSAPFTGIEFESYHYTSHQLSCNSPSLVDAAFNRSMRPRTRAEACRAANRGTFA